MLFTLEENPAYAVERDTILKLDSASGFERVGKEMVFQGTLKTTDNYSVTYGTIIIKTNSNLNDSDVIASGTTDARGKFSIRTIAGDWGENIDVYAVFLGNSEYNSAVSNSKSLSIRQAYSYEPAAKNPPTNEDSKFLDPLINQNSPTTYSPSTYGTELVLSIQKSSELGYAKVYPALTMGDKSSLNLENIQILVDNSLIETVSSNMWSKEIFVGSGDLITASFPTTTVGSVVYTLSQDTIKIPQNIAIPATVSENIDNLVREWDWPLVIGGLLAGVFIKIVLEHKPTIKAFKNIAFIIGALILIALFVVSEDNNISENLGMFDPEQLVPTGNPNYFVFGILISYIFGWIKEILKDNDISLFKKTQNKKLPISNIR
ncbi:hypothetical protein [Nitrosopumilus sp.]|uniref:hypothetical protein n=1 Tax=Nitrosopumilus sp. TaxID=2024843 RepID=UPI00247BE309|nr:hypothetical protein [Nitrosopumilus sp.]MCV0409936.1 hypothetical protein [Nitrosopumilus sp.]